MLKKIFIICMIIINTTTVAGKKSGFSFKPCKGTYKKSYSPKAAYSGFGKQSKTTGKIKTKSVKGHFKPSNNYKFVNPYSRSKYAPVEYNSKAFLTRNASSSFTTISFLSLASVIFL